jgi:CRP-like cAMP-binding protein
LPGSITIHLNAAGSIKEGVIQLLRRSEQIDVYNKIPLFSHLSKRNLNQIAKVTDQISLKADTVLAKEGDLGREFIVIVKGKVRVQKKKKVLRHLSKGDYFGEISLIDPGVRTASVIAETDVELMVINSQSFNHLLNNIDGLAKKMLIAFCKYLRSQDMLLSEKA